MSIPFDEKNICMAEKLSSQNIVLNLKSENKTDLIKELAERLKGHPNLLNFNQFVKDIFKRGRLVCQPPRFCFIISMNIFFHFKLYTLL